jgi:hypothetical protein
MKKRKKKPARNECQKFGMKLAQSAPGGEAQSPAKPISINRTPARPAASAAPGSPRTFADAMDQNRARMFENMFGTPAARSNALNAMTSAISNPNAWAGTGAGKPTPKPAAPPVPAKPATPVLSTTAPAISTPSSIVNNAVAAASPQSPFNTQTLTTGGSAPVGMPPKQTPEAVSPASPSTPLLSTTAPTISTPSSIVGSALETKPGPTTSPLQASVTGRSAPGGLAPASPAAGPRVGREQPKFPLATRATPEQKAQIAAGNGALPAAGLNRFGVDPSTGQPALRRSGSPARAPQQPAPSTPLLSTSSPTISTPSSIVNNAVASAPTKSPFNTQTLTTGGSAPAGVPPKPVTPTPTAPAAPTQSGREIFNNAMSAITNPAAWAGTGAGKPTPKPVTPTPAAPAAPTQSGREIFNNVMSAISSPDAWAGTGAGKPDRPTGPPSDAEEIATAFAGGMGQGVKNMFGAMGDFGRGTARVLTAPFAAEIGRSMQSDPAVGQEYADDMYRHYENAWRDVGNSFGRFVGVHDAWDPNTGQYRGAQPANATQQHTQELGQKYFNGDPRSSDLGLAYNAANTVGDMAAESVGLAAAAPVAGAQLMRIPGMAAAGNAVNANPILRRALTYGAGLPTSAPARPGLFMASNMGQNLALGAGVPGAEYLPANIVDTATREVAGDLAPEVLDAVRGRSNMPVAVMSAVAPVAQMRGESAQYGAEQKEIATNNTAQSLSEQLSASLTPDRVNSLDDAAYAQLQELESSLAGKSVEEQIPIFQQMQSLVDTGTIGTPQQPQQQRGNAFNTFMSAISNPDAWTNSGGAGQTAPGQETPQQAPAAASSPGQQTAQTPMTPDVSSAVAGALPADATPEMRAEVDSGVTAVSDAVTQNPELQARLQQEGGVEAVNNENKETSVQRLAEERMQQNPGPENPRDWATWLNETTTWASQKWEELGPIGQLAFGLGMPLGVIGLLGGGLSGVLTAVLGFGVAGLAAAGTGAFGETAQNTLTNAANTATFGAQNAVNNASAAVSGGEQPAASAVTPPKPLEEILSAEQLQALSPAQRSAIDEARNNPGQFRTAARESFMAAGRDGFPTGAFGEFLNLPADVQASLFQQLDPAEQPKLLESLNTASSWAGPGMMSLNNKKLQQSINNAIAAISQQKNGAYMNKTASQIVARHLAISSMQKAARCWSGYEPVPGKKPYSNDSCRPIGGKKKKKKKAAK